MGRVSNYVRAVKQTAARREAHDTAGPGGDGASASAASHGSVIGQAVRVERRSQTRRACRRTAFSQPRVSPRGLMWEAVLQDISRHGVGLVLTDRCRRGTVLQIDLPTPRVNRTLLARVQHASAQANGWFHGCQLLIPLTAAELEELAP